MNIIYFSLDCQIFVVDLFFFSGILHAIYLHSQMTMYKFLLRIPHMQIGIGVNTICHESSVKSTQCTKIDKLL